MIWTDCNMGSKVTMKYPGFILAGKGARGQVLSMALAGEGQHQDTGAKAIHLAPHTSSTIIAKSISKAGGRTSYRGMVNIGFTAKIPNNNDGIASKINGNNIIQCSFKCALTCSSIFSLV